MNTIKRVFLKPFTFVEAKPSVYTEHFAWGPVDGLHLRVFCRDSGSFAFHLADKTSTVHVATDPTWDKAFELCRLVGEPHPDDPALRKLRSVGEWIMISEDAFVRADEVAAVYRMESSAIRCHIVLRNGDRFSAAGHPDAIVEQLHKAVCERRTGD